MPVTRMAVAWLRREDYARWRAIEPNFEPDYDDWAKRMGETVAVMQKTGFPVEKIVIEPNEFIEWCRVNKRPVDFGSRAAFAVVKLNASHDRDG